MAGDRRRARGNVGEDIAAEHMRATGYEILERNFRTRRGELDLVAADARAIVFCEVKTRVAGGRAGPALALDAIGPRKRHRVRALAGEWLHARRADGRAPRRQRLRFDAIGVTLSPSGRVLRLEHLEDAF
ncbi:MAG TPA: YraN family protein [Thermoleophilaceae bacterium]|jgi:putative endonuclease